MGGISELQAQRLERLGVTTLPFNGGEVADPNNDWGNPEVYTRLLSGDNLMEKIRLFDPDAKWVIHTPADAQRFGDQVAQLLKTLGKKMPSRAKNWCV